MVLPPLGKGKLTVSETVWPVPGRVSVTVSVRRSTRRGWCVSWTSEGKAIRRSAVSAAASSTCWIAKPAPIPSSNRVSLSATNGTLVC